MTQKKIYKVLTPIKKRNSQESWFMRVGSAYTNKDDSINLYIDAVPVGIAPGEGMTLQIRELDENDLKQREANRARYGSNRPLATGSGGASVASESADVPF